MTRRFNPLSLASSILFLIGTLYYSYIHLASAYYTMCKLNAYAKPDGTTQYKLEFSVSNVNTSAVLSVLLVLAMCAATVLLIVCAIKNKCHILPVAFSASILAVQLAVRAYTMLHEFTFARYVLRLGEMAYDVCPVLKYIPFVAALLLSVVCFTVARLSRKSETICA